LRKLNVDVRPTLKGVIDLISKLLQKFLRFPAELGYRPVLRTARTR